MLVRFVIVCAALSSVSAGALANCKASNAMKGYWTFQLAGNSIFDDVDGYNALTSYNGRQLDLYGNLFFNNSSTLVRGKAIESTDALGALLGVTEFDDDDYQGLVIDKKMSASGVKFNKWKKSRNSCAADVVIGFRGKDLVNGRAFTKVYCFMGMWLAKTKHTATLNGYCIRERLVDGELKNEFSPVSGMMQKRTNGSW